MFVPGKNNNYMVYSPILPFLSSYLRINTVDMFLEIKWLLRALSKSQDWLAGPWWDQSFGKK